MNILQRNLLQENPFMNICGGFPSGKSLYDPFGSNSLQANPFTNTFGGKSLEANPFINGPDLGTGGGVRCACPGGAGWVTETL